MAKVVVVFALMALHAGFAVWLLSRPEVVAGTFYGALQPAARPDLLGDQHLGAILGWALAEIPVVIAVIELVRRWTAEDREIGITRLLTRDAFETHKIANPLHTVTDGEDVLRFPW